MMRLSGFKDRVGNHTGFVKSDKPLAQEKRQDDDEEDISDSEEDEPSKKKRRKECFSLGCEVHHIEFDDRQPVYLDKQKLQKEAQQRLDELDTSRREYQWTVSAYEDLYQWCQEEHGLSPLYIDTPMRLGELQVDPKKKAQLMYMIGQILKESSTSYQTQYPLSNEQELFINKWRNRCCFKYDLITKIQDMEKAEKKVQFEINEMNTGRMLESSILSYVFNSVEGEVAWD